ncbi:uncharacterized protein METZ01_LOCUS432585 [marine metagenome]|uniref:Uncharacterized protein n=1 Tax=marine metagenome TaxID=408172 RepID=A0A382YA69_9ZZZZ
MYNGYIVQAKIRATEAKHKHVVSYFSTSWLKCTSGASTVGMQTNPTSYSQLPCTWVMADARRWVVMSQYHFQLTGYLNPYNTSLHKSWGVSYANGSTCAGNGTPKNWGGGDSRGGTCIVLTGNAVQVVSNIGDDNGRNKYLRNTIILE